jgi:threonine dehydrogenase-like Zn-dependent dehydrogenase
VKAITVEPGSPVSLALSDTEEPAAAGALSVQAIAIGICGTDHEIIAGGHGAPPPGTDRLILGHESLGRVIDAPDGCGFTRGDLVVGIVRRPDPEPCAACASGQWDMCLNGGYTERGISGHDGYGSEAYALEPDFAVAVDAGLGLHGVLVEPTSIVTKAWRKVDELARLNIRPLASVLVTGAGPIGLLAAMLGRQRGLAVHVLDRVTSGPKPALVRRLGAAYHQTLDSCPSTDAVLECTGSPALVPEVIGATNRNAVVCLAGVSERASETIDVGSLNRELVLENDIVFGSVNANAADYRRAVQHLVDADASWLDDVITRRVPLSRWREAYERRDGDVKTVMLFDDEM